MMASVRKKELRSALNIDDKYEILLVVALGKPKEIVKLTELEEGGDTKYWRDKDQVHHVPKRKLNNIIVKQFA